MLRGAKNTLFRKLTLGRGAKLFALSKINFVRGLLHIKEENIQNGSWRIESIWNCFGDVVVKQILDKFSKFNHIYFIFFDSSMLNVCSTINTEYLIVIQ